MQYKKRMSLYIILLAMSVVLLYMARYIYVNSTSVRDYDEIKSEGVLRMAIDYNPVSYYYSGDSIMGFDYELAQLISKRSGLQVELHPEVNLAKSFEGLDNLQYDIIARPLAVTTENKEKYNFTEPIQLNKQVLVQRRKQYNDGKKPIRNQLDLAGKNLYIVSDAPTRLRIENLSHEIGDTIYITEENLYGEEQLIMKVATGEIDFAVCDVAIAKKMAREYPEIDVYTDISFTQFQSWALRKNSPILLDSLNLWLNDIKAMPAFDNLEKKYFSRKH